MRKLLSASLIALAPLVACSAHDHSDAERDDLPELPGPTLSMGALLSITGALAAEAPDLERAALLAEEFINGSTRVHGDDTAAIPCRRNGSCGVWVGEQGGTAERGRLAMVVADTAERPERAVLAAREIAERYDAPAFIGPCTDEEVHAVHAEVTGTQRILVSPSATADSITAIDDRSAEDRRDQRAGYVYRSVAPDYIQAEVLAQVATNLEDPPALVRFEDQTDDECTDQEDGDAYCATRHGGQQGMRCLAQARTEAPERLFYKYSDTRCDGEPASFCDSLGKFYECVPAPGQTDTPKVCARYRYRRFCTRVVQPRTALVLFPNTDVGHARRREVEDYWVKRKSNFLLASEAYDPGQPDTFASIIQRLFVIAAFRLGELQGEGKLTRGHGLQDSVVFFFGGTTDGALLLQEWSTQGEALAAGASDVLWLATDALRNRIFLSYLPFSAVRNLYVISPYTTDINNAEFFDKLFFNRWQREPGNYAGSVFDAVLALALAVERAGALRAARGGGGALAPSSAAEIKDSLPAITVGCERSSLTEACPSVPPVRIFSPADYSAAVQALHQGNAVRLQGVTGNLSFSPEGDRISDFSVWSVTGSAEQKRFIRLRRYSPQEHGINLRK